MEQRRALRRQSDDHHFGSLMMLAVTARSGQYDAPDSLLRFISDHRIKILNIAGPRASKEPQIAAFVKKVLEEAFCPRPDPFIGGPGEG